ncbi:MAG: ADP-ribosylglycohydrolase family protein [Deltaproteobacteria bacterium]|nr:ADP-ribosylglycohydrolase family protein [Deltaproteobacteria bacterium]
MKKKAEAMVLGSFLGDSLALGAHWIYDQEQLAGRFGRVDSLRKPTPDSYHPTKDAGEFTHYGDQTLVLLQSLAAAKGFDPADFSLKWQKSFEEYRGYIDRATRQTLDNFAAGANPAGSGSPSHDLAGASRIAPLIYRYRNDLDALVQAGRSQTAMTHNDPFVIDSAEYFARVTHQVLQGGSPVESMDLVAQEHFSKSTIYRLVQAGLDSKQEDSLTVIARFGQSCAAESAFPGVVQLLARHEQDFSSGLIDCVMAGGDSAGRGMLVGMVLGAHLGLAGLPREWLNTLKKYDEILLLLTNLE